MIVHLDPILVELDVDPSRIFSCLWLACKNLRLLLGLTEKRRKRTFSAKKFPSYEIFG